MNVLRVVLHIHGECTALVPISTRHRHSHGNCPVM